MQNKKRQGKWLPFDSLEGYSLNEVEKEFEREKQPELSEDKIEELNNNIIHAFKENIQVKIILYNNSKILNKVGYIKKIDSMNQYIH